MEDRFVYSLWPTGVAADDTAAFNTAVGAIDRGELIIRDNGKKLVLDGSIASPSAISNPVRIRGESANVTVKLNNAFQVNWGVDDNPATSGTPVAFSGLGTGETKFQSPSLSLAQGDWVLLIADDTIVGTDGHIISGVQHPAELHRVEYVDASDVYIDMPVCDDYSVNPRIMKVTMIPNCGLVDLQLESDTQYAPGVVTQQWNWKINNTIDFRWENIRCLEDGPGYLAIYKSARAQFLNYSGLHMATNAWDYGVVIGPCRDTLFADSSWSGSRHVTSTTGWDNGTDRWGTPRSTVIRNVIARVPDDNDRTQWVTFDCHAEGYGTIFDSCKCYIGTQQQGYAFSTRARNTIYKDCEVIGGQVDGAPKNNSHYGIRFLAADCSVIGCRVENVWIGVQQNTGSQGGNYSGFSVIDSEFIDCSSVAIRQTTTGNGAYIKGNRFKNCGTYNNIISPFIPKAFICIEGGTDHTIRLNDLSKDGNDYSIWCNTLTEANFDIRGNVFEGYGDGKLGVADGATSGALAVNYDFDGAFARYNVADNSSGVVNVKEYGAVGDGVTDDTLSLSTAIATGNPVYLPPGDYLVQDLDVTADQDVVIFGPGVLRVAANTNGLDVALPMGSLITPTSITSEDSSTQANSPKVTEVNATSHGLAVGDVVKFVANATYSDLRSVTAVVGELAVVESVPDANTFRLNKELEDIATSDAGIVCRKLSTAKVDINVRVNKTGSQAVQTGVPQCVRVANAVNPRIVVDCDQSHETVLLVENCLGGEAKVYCNWAADDEANGVFGYAMRIGGACVGLKGSVVCGPVRHAVTSKDADGVAYATTEATMSEVGRSRDITIHDSTAKGCHSSAFDTHANAQRWTFQNCKAIWSGIVDEDSGYLPVGFQVRGRDMTFTDCESVGGRTGFSDVSPSAHNGAWRTDFYGCRAFQARLRGIHIDQAGMTGTDQHHVRINGGVFEARSAAATIEDCFIDIQGAEFRYYGFSSPVTMAQATATLQARFNGCLFNHTTDNDQASIQLTSGTADVQVLDCFTQLFSNLQTDGLIEAESGTTLTLYHRNWRWTSGKSHQGMTSGLGAITYTTSATAADADATPSVYGLTILTTANTGPTTITSLDGGYAGQTVTVVIGDGNTTVDFTGTTLKGNSGADWSPASGDHMVCTFDGTNWYCQVSDNTA